MLYVLIGRFAIPRIGGIIEARRGRIEGDLAEANRLKEQSDAALKSYEKSLADARGRAQALANETRDKLDAEAEEARKALEGRAQFEAHRSREDHRHDQDRRHGQRARHRGRYRHRHRRAADRHRAFGSAVEAAVADALKR